MNKNNTNDYFSDDDEVELEENTMENLQDEEEYESDGSMDEETRRIVFQAVTRNMNWDNLTYNVKKEPVQKKKEETNSKPKKTKNVFSLSDFVKKLDEDEKAKQPKKFVSKRVEDKKKQLGAVEEPNKMKRTFNPRLPPYNFAHKKKEFTETVNLNNAMDFPSLK